MANNRYTVTFEPKESLTVEVVAPNASAAKDIAMGRIAKKACTKSTYHIECEETSYRYW